MMILFIFQAACILIDETASGNGTAILYLYNVKISARYEFYATVNGIGFPSVKQNKIRRENTYACERTVICATLMARWRLI